MLIKDIPNYRLYSQQIASTKFKSAKELVSWMGALQAQDFKMVKWAVGVRLKGITENTVDSLIDKGALLRTHLLRPTWHLVAADDIYWLLELTGPGIKNRIKSRNKQLELTEDLLSKSTKLIENAFKETNQVTREKLVTEFVRAKIPMDDNRAAHILLIAELDGFLCSGAVKGSTTTYALLSERVKKPLSISREEALSKLAMTYFSSRGPATIQDYTNWSGLSMTEAKKGINAVKSKITGLKEENLEYWFNKSSVKHAKENNELYLLPSFDEYIIAYKDRSNILSSENHKTAISINGIFWPVIIQHGIAIGIWKRTIKKEKVFLETFFFKKPHILTLEMAREAALAYGKFLGLEAEISNDSKYYSSKQ